MNNNSGDQLSKACVVANNPYAPFVVLDILLIDGVRGLNLARKEAGY